MSASIQKSGIRVADDKIHEIRSVLLAVIIFLFKKKYEARDGKITGFALVN